MIYIMSLPERRPKVQTLAHQLRELDKAPDMARAVLASAESGPEDDIEKMIYRCYGKLINLFNDFDTESIYDELVPKVVELKGLLGDTDLPALDELSARDLLSGVRASSNLMVEGQTNKRRRKAGQLITKAEIDHAIGAPSLDTTPEALAVGTSSHIIERTMMAYLAGHGVDTSTWSKDQILWALEELAVLAHAENYTYGDDDMELFDYFISPPSTEAGGGLGWRKATQVDEVCTRYQEIETTNKYRLIECLSAVMGDDLTESMLDDISSVPYEEALGNVFAMFLSEEDANLAERYAEYEAQLQLELARAD